MNKKYSRAIKDLETKKKLNKQNKCRNLFLGLGFIPLFLSLAPIINETTNEIFLISSMIFSLLALGMFLISIVISVQIHKNSKQAIQNEELDLTLELDSAIFKYKTELLAYEKSFKKSLRIPTIILVLFSIVGVALFVAGMLVQDEKLSMLLIYSCTGSFSAGFLVLFWASFMIGFKNGQDWWETKIANEIKLIDKANSVQTNKVYKEKYNILLDKNAQNAKILFPTEEIRTEVEKLKKISMKRLGIVLVISIFLGVVAGFFAVFLEALWLIIVAMVLVMVGTYLGSLDIIKKIKRLEDRQLDILKGDLVYEKNLIVFEKTREYTKQNNKRMLIFGVGIALVLPIVLSIFHLGGLGVLLAFVWLIVFPVVSSKKFEKLRIELVPIENEIIKELEAKELKEKEDIFSEFKINEEAVQEIVDSEQNNAEIELEDSEKSEN